MWCRIAACVIATLASTGTRADPPVTDSPAAATPEPILPIEQSLERIEDLKRRVTREATEIGQRKAADELVLARKKLLRQHALDARLSLWLADFAEDSFTIVLPSGGDVDRVLYGLAGAEPRRRVRALVLDMLKASEQAELAAKATLAMTGADAPTQALADRLSQVERPRRIPLLRALAEVLQVEVGEFDSAKRRALAEAAIARVETLLPELDDRTASVVQRYTGLAAARIDDERTANRLLSQSREKAAKDEALATLADLAALRAAGLLRGPGAAADAAGLLRESGSIARRLALAELEARLRRQQQGEAGSSVNPAGASATREWTSPFTDMVRRSSTQEAPAIRDAAIARLIMILNDGITLPEREPMGLLGNANARLDAGQDATAFSQPLLELCLNAQAPPAIRAGALRTVARIDMAAEHWSDAADRSMRLAREHATDPSSAAAISLAIRIARELDRAADAGDAVSRTRLENAISLGIKGFPEHSDQPLWQLERQTLATEAKAAERASELSDAAPFTQAADDATTQWLRARYAAALACIRLRDGDATGAMAALDASTIALTGSAASRRLAARVAILAELDRDPSADAEIRKAASDCNALLAQVTHERMRALLPSELFPIQPASTPTINAATARRLRDTLELSKNTDAGLWTTAGDLLRLRGDLPEATLAYERALAVAADAREALLGQAEVMFMMGGEKRFISAMAIHRRLLSGREMTANSSLRDHAWWLSQLRELQVLQAANRFDERALIRLNRLQSLDASYGGEDFARAFALLPRSATVSMPSP